VFSLPQPVQRNGVDYTVLLMGKRGRAVLLSVDSQTPMALRLYKPRNGLRPVQNGSSCGDDRSNQVLRLRLLSFFFLVLLQTDRACTQSTAVPLLLRGGELLVIGGCQPTADLYNVQNDSWTSVDLGIHRNVPRCMETSLSLSLSLSVLRPVADLLILSSAILLPDGKVMLLNGRIEAADIHTHTRTHIHAHTHTYIRTHTQTHTGRAHRFLQCKL
jgi:hypothetical protein